MPPKKSSLKSKRVIGSADRDGDLQARSGGSTVLQASVAQLVAQQQEAHGKKNKKNKGGKDGKEEYSSLASEVCRSREKRMAPPPEHPLRDVLLAKKVAVPAVSLEQWFDCGLQGSDQGLTGVRPLPVGYTGFEQGRILIVAERSGIVVWPVRVDLGEVGSDDLKPFTLYHFTHKGSFDRFSAMFQNGKSDFFQDTLFMQLKEDYIERVPTPHPQNVKGDPQLTAVEPVKFLKKRDALVHLFGRQPSGFSRQGHKLEEMADYCIAFRVPASCCIDLSGTMASDAAIKVCRDTLEALGQRNEARREVLRQRAEQEKAKKAAMAKKGKTSALARFCQWLWCGTSPDAQPEFWDELEREADQGQNEKEQRKRVPREVDYWKGHMTNQFVKEHFANVEKVNEHEMEKAAKKRNEKMRSLKDKMEVLKKEQAKTVTLNQKKNRMRGEQGDGPRTAAEQIEDLQHELRELQLMDVHPGSANDKAGDKFLNYGREEQPGEVATAARREMKARPMNEEALRAPTGTRRGERRDTMMLKKPMMLSSKRDDSDEEDEGGASEKVVKLTSSRKGVKIGGVESREFGADGSLDDVEEDDEDEDADQSPISRASSDSPTTDRSASNLGTSDAGSPRNSEGSGSRSPRGLSPRAQAALESARHAEADADDAAERNAE